MRTFAYELVFRTHDGERTIFDKLRKSPPHLGDVTEAVRMIGVHADDGCDVGTKRQHVPRIFARLGEEYAAREPSVPTAAHRQIAHANGRTAYVRDEIDTACRKDVCRHRGHGGLAVRARHRDHGVEILRDEGKQLMALDDAFAHRERERNLFVRERHGG